MILILSHHDDPHVAAVVRHLRPADYFLFDPADFPLRSAIELEVSNSTESRKIRQGGRSVRLDQVTTVWHRRPRPSEVDPSAGDVAAAYARAESAAVLSDLWQSLECEHVPAKPHLIKAASHKFTQLSAARRIGFEIPVTVITNTADRLISFFNEQSGSIISKVVVPPSLLPESAHLGRFTEAVTLRDLAFANAMKLCPALLQPRIEKAYELRVTVIGSEIFAVRIDSQATLRTQVDWRRYDLDNTPHALVPLPPAVAQKCRELMAFLGLRFATLDFIVTPDGRYVFLELNPNGQWLWLEVLIGVQLASSMARQLSGARQ